MGRDLNFYKRVNGVKSALQKLRRYKVENKSGPGLSLDLKK
jgi:hypothetical protein